MKKTLTDLNFKAPFTQNFKGEDEVNFMPRQTPNALYAKIRPEQPINAKLIGHSSELLSELKIDSLDQGSIDILTGSPDENIPYYSLCYGGHQFGHWAGQLGDGRAIILGEVEGVNQRWELQLKGAGRTPYSRRADGKAVLRSSVREFLMSESMHYLGVPTTRALSLTLTGEDVLRDMFYDGNPDYEQGAVVCRMAESFLRFGNFELLAAREEIENLRSLVTYTIENYYPNINPSDQDSHFQFYSEVFHRSIDMVIHWMRVGFTHGVMNTDNMSILGLTIDYGPYSMLDKFDLNFTPNTTDLPGRRYAYGRQPSVVYWNLAMLAESLFKLEKNNDEIKTLLQSYQEIFYKKYELMMHRKLSLKESDKSTEFVQRTLQVLEKFEFDYTSFFKVLETIHDQSNIDKFTREDFKDFSYKDITGDDELLIKAYLKEYLTLKDFSDQAQRLMKESNPSFILRNYLLHVAISELNQGKSDTFDQLQKALKDPYSDEHLKSFPKKAPEWAFKTAGCSQLSCSS